MCCVTACCYTFYQRNCCDLHDCAKSGARTGHFTLLFQKKRKANSICLQVMFYNHVLCIVAADRLSNCNIMLRSGLVSSSYYVVVWKYGLL